MNICGLDLSMNSSGLVKLTLDENLNIIDKDYMGFTQVKKHESDRIHYFKKETFKHRYSLTNWMLEHMKSFYGDCDYFAIEDYAFGANGVVFDIAEFAGSIKKDIFDSGKNIRLYDPNSIKKFATGKGNSDKLSMYRSYEEYSGDKLVISSLPEPTTGKGISPTSDIVDAFWISQLLLTELRLRRGLIRTNDLDEAKVSIFNRVTKSQPQNILDTDFISK